MIRGADSLAEETFNRQMKKLHVRGPSDQAPQTLALTVGKGKRNGNKRHPAASI